MNITIKENQIKKYIAENNNLHLQIIKIYNTDYQRYLRANKKIYTSYFMSKYNLSKYKKSAITLQSFINTILLSVSDYLPLFIMFLNYLETHHSTIRATTEQILISYIIRTLYQPYQGFNAELLIHNHINKSNYYTICNNSYIDIAYRIDLLLRSSNYNLAIQVKSKTVIKTLDRIQTTEQKLEEYTNNTDIKHYYLLYNKDTKQPIKYQIAPLAYCYLITYEQLQTIAETPTEQHKLIDGTMEQLHNNLESLFFVRAVS